MQECFEFVARKVDYDQNTVKTCSTEIWDRTGETN